MNYYQQPPPRPRSSGGGCITFVLMACGIFAALIFVGVTAMRVIATPTKDEKAKIDDKIAADAKDAAAQQFAFELGVRKACKVGEAGALFMIPDSEMKDHCYDRIRSSLKVPGSSDFPYGEDVSRGMLSDDGGCRRIFKSYFDAQNAFGVKIRTHYECTYDPRSSAMTVKNLD